MHHTFVQMISYFQKYTDTNLPKRYFDIVLYVQNEEMHWDTLIDTIQQLEVLTPL